MKPSSAILILSVLLPLSSCSRRQYPQQSTDTVTTITVTETLHDTIITVRSDTSMIQALIECDSTGQAYLSEIMQLKSAARLHQDIRLQANVLTATADIDSMSIYLTYKDRYRTTETTRTETNTVTVTTNILKSWQKLLMFIGALTLIITAVKLYLKLSL